MSLPTLAELPAILLSSVSRAEQSLRTAVAELEHDHGLSTWPPSAGRNWPALARPATSSLSRVSATR